MSFWTWVDVAVVIAAVVGIFVTRSQAKDAKTQEGRHAYRGQTTLWVIIFLNSLFSLGH